MSEFEDWYELKLIKSTDRSVNQCVKIATSSAWNAALDQAKQAAMSVDPAHIEREIDKFRVVK